MAAVWMRLRAEARYRWRAWLALGVAIGIASGASIAAASGALRADSAYPRFVQAQRAAHVTLGGIAADEAAVIEDIRRRIASFPEVVDSQVGQFVTGSAVVRRTGKVAAFPNILVVGSTEARQGIDFDKPKLLEGRLYDRSAPDEGIIDWIAADKLGVGLGDVVDVRLFDVEGGGESAPAVVLAPVRVVGIAVFPGSVPAVGQTPLSGLAVTPAFMRSYAKYVSSSNDAPTVLLGGEEDIASFLTRVRELPNAVDIVSTLPDHVAGVQRTLRFEVLALWALSALLGLGAVAIFGQALTRMTLVESAGFSSLGALGMSRAALTVVGIARGCAVGGVATLVACGVAVAASTFTPIGISRVVEPEPGIALNGMVLAVGLAATLLAVAALTVWPSFRAAKAGEPTIPRRPSVLAAAVAGRAPVATATGIRMALDPGRGRRAVPTRTAVLGSLIGIAAVAASLVFASGLGHLIRTPELYGFNWSQIVAAQGEEESKLEDAFRQDPDVQAMSRGGVINLVVGGKPLIPFVYEPGPIGPTILSGRAPMADDEIVLGPSLMRALDLRMGDSVAVEIPQEGARSARGRLRVVGTTVVPAVLFQQVQPGEGAAMTMDAIRRIAPDMIRPGQELPWIVRYRPGVDVDAKHGALHERFPFMFTIQLRQPGGDLISLVRVEQIPVALAGLLAFMAAATLMHALLSSIRRRRHDLAVLKTLGFQTGQVRRAVGWQASVLAAIALAAGLPLGIVAGRWAWRAFATDLGVVDVPRVPLVAIGLIVPATLVLAAMIAAFPARAAARTRPATVLRAE